MTAFTPKSTTDIIIILLDSFVHLQCKSVHCRKKSIQHLTHACDTPNILKIEIEIKENRRNWFPFTRLNYQDNSILRSISFCKENEHFPHGLKSG